MNLSLTNSNRMIAMALGPVSLLMIAGCSQETESRASRLEEPSSKPVLSKFDTDGDGKLSKGEQDAMAADYAKSLDQDGDGKLSAGESREAQRQSKITVVGRASQEMTAEDAERFFRPFDQNRDGKLSAEEVGANRWKVLQLSDTDKDGHITIEEWQARSARSLGGPSPSAQ